MKKFAVVAAAAALIALVSAPAVAGPGYLLGTNAKGKAMKAGKYRSSTRLYRSTEWKKLRASTRKKYSQKATYCGQEFMVSKAQMSFVQAHKKMKHMVIARERVARRKFKKLCDVS